MANGVNSYGFADGNGYEITRGYQCTEEQARAFAQQRANDLGTTVECWEEGDVNEEGEEVSSLFAVEPE